MKTLTRIIRFVALVALLSASCGLLWAAERPNLIVVPVPQPKTFWDAIEARPLPEGYHGSRHQEFVDGVMEKMKPEQRTRVPSIRR